MEFSFSLQMLLLSIGFLFIPLYIYHFFLNPKSKPSTSAVGFKQYPFIGALPELHKNRHRFLEWTTEVLSRCPTNTFLFKVPGMRAVFTANPLNVEHIFRSKSENYIKDQNFISVLEDFFGHGLLTSDGQRWKNQRKVVGHEFSTRSLRNFWTDNVLQVQTRFVSLLEKAARTGEILDLQHLLHCFAFDNICRLAFDVDLGCLGAEEIKECHHEFRPAFLEALSLTLGRFEYPLRVFYKIKKFFNVGSEKRLTKLTKIVHEFVEKQINDRVDGRCANIGDKDFLSRFMDKSSSGNAAEYFVKDNLIALILAGSGTTTSALTWFFWLVSSNPEVKNKIAQELEVIRLQKMKKIGDTYDLDDLQEMNYLQAAISESMRLYPPTIFEMTLCKADDILPDGTFVAKNWTAGYNAYAMGRMEKIWGKDCDDYKPERWLENGLFKPESPFRFPIFHAGPRMCLGRDLAYIQMKSLAAVLLERFELDVLLESGKSPDYLVSFAFHMKGGLPVRVKERHHVI